MIKWNVTVKNSDYYVFGMEKSNVGYGILKNQFNFFNSYI
jgi:hypothetical protein